MVLYGIPRRKGKYDGLSDEDPVSIEPDNQVAMVLMTIFYMVAMPFYWIYWKIVDYVKLCNNTAYKFLKKWNYHLYVNRKR